MKINRMQIALTLLFIIFMAMVIRHCSKIEKENTDLHIKDHSNLAEMARIADKVQTLVVEKEALQDAYQHVLDSLGQAKSRLEEVIKVQTQADYKIQATLMPDTVRTVDTVFVQRRFGYTSPYLSLSGSLRDDLLSFDITTYDSLTFLKTSRFRFLRPRQHTVTVISSNPHVQIRGLNHIIYQEKPRRIGIGPFIGVGLGKKLVIGFGVQYSIIRF